MSARPVRLVVAVVLAIGATWFVARAAHGADPVVWHTTVRDGPWELAADHGGLVVTTGQQSVSALTPKGRVQWRAHVDDLIFGQPAVSDARVLVGGEHTVTALDRADGHVRWQHPTGGRARSLTLAAGTALVGDDTGTLAAFDAGTGAERWSVRFPGSPWAGARVDVSSGAVVATWHQTTEPAVRVLDLADGSVRWSAPTDRFTAAPVVRAGIVVVAVGDGNRHARVEAHDLATGAERWRTTVPASFEEAIEPAADGRTVIVVDHFGVVSALDLRTGTIRWQHDLAAPLLATRVVLTGSRVSLTTNPGDLYVLDRRDGRLVARLTPERLGGAPVATLRPPGRAAGRLLVALRMRDWGVELRRLP
jgi:outer membrane protein assembly factor BamB